MLRTILQSGLVLLLAAAILFGGCMECPKSCCLKSQHCGKVQAEQTATLPAAAHHVEVPAALPAVAPIRVQPDIRILAESAPWRFFEESPPDLCLLHSVLRV